MDHPDDEVIRDMVDAAFHPLRALGAERGADLNQLAAYQVAVLRLLLASPPPIAKLRLVRSEV